MDSRWRIANVSGLDDREMGLLAELRILDEANMLAPVLEMMAASLEALYVESERQAWAKTGDGYYASLMWIYNRK